MTSEDSIEDVLKAEIEHLQRKYNQLKAETDEIAAMNIRKKQQAAAQYTKYEESQKKLEALNQERQHKAKTIQDELRDTIQTVQSQKQALMKQVNNANDRLLDLQKQLTDKSAESNALAEEYKRTYTQNIEYQQKIAETSEQIEKMQHIEQDPNLDGYLEQFKLLAQQHKLQHQLKCQQQQQIQTQIYNLKDTLGNTAMKCLILRDIEQALKGILKK